MSHEETRIVVGVKDPGPCPEKPLKPRNPQEMFRRTEEIWSSEHESTDLADLLHLIPDGVTADCIHINVGQNPDNGYIYTSISYDYDIPNLKYKEQLVRYEKRMVAYEKKLAQWDARYQKWLAKRTKYDEVVQRMKADIEKAFERHGDILSCTLDVI